MTASDIESSSGLNKEQLGDSMGADYSTKARTDISSSTMGAVSWNVKHLPTFIAVQVARQDFNSVKKKMSLVPLKFHDKFYEKRFFDHIVSSYNMRARFVCVISCVLLLGYWIVYGICVGMSIYPFGNSVSTVIGFHVAMIFTMASVVFLWITASKRLIKRMEVWLYLSCFFNVVCPQIWVMSVTRFIPSETPVDVINIQEFKLSLAPYTLGLPLWCVASTCLFFQTRTKVSFFPILGTVFVLLIFDLAQAIILTKKQLNDDVEVYHEDRFGILIASLECVALMLAFFMCHFGRWNSELKERIEFWKLTKSQDQLEELRDTTSKKKKKTGSTAVEDLLDIIMRAVNSVQEAEVATGNQLLVESTDMLRQIQSVLTNSDNLYAVKISPDRKQSKEAGCQDSELEAQFYEIYAQDKAIGAKAVKYQTEKPFGGLNETHNQNGLNVGFNVRSIAPQPQASAEFRRSVGRDWNCNILKASEEYPNIMVEVGALLLEPKSDDLEISPIKIRNFVFRLERLYRRNPYHNAAHGAMVAHSLTCLLRLLDVTDSPELTALDNVSLIVAALGHDAGHPGRNNQFYINAFQKLALLWNDKAVLENFHSALVFKSLESKTCNIFEGLDDKTIKGMRRKIIDLILATDMSQHFESVSKFKLRRQAAGFNYMLEEDDMWMVIRMCIKCADLGHALVDWSQHQEWSLRVNEEFYQQGDEEALLGLPKSPLCDRFQHTDFPKSQKGFIEFVVQPLLTQIEEIDPGEKISETCIKHLTYNKYRWEEMAREKRTIPIPDNIQTLKTDSHSARVLVMHIVVPPHYRLEGLVRKPITRLRKERSIRALEPKSIALPNDSYDIQEKIEKEDQEEYEGFDEENEGYAEDESYAEEGDSYAEEGESYAEEGESYAEEGESYAEEGEDDHESEELQEEVEDVQTLEQFQGFHVDDQRDWNAERASTLATARFGGESFLDDVDEDVPFPESDEEDALIGDDGTTAQNSEWWEDEDDENQEELLNYVSGELDEIENLASDDFDGLNVEGFLDLEEQDTRDESLSSPPKRLPSNSESDTRQKQLSRTNLRFKRNYRINNMARYSTALPFKWSNVGMFHSPLEHLKNISALGSTKLAAEPQFLSSINLMPLRFIEDCLEKSYFDNCVKSYRFRTRIATTMTFLLFLGTWIICGISISTGVILGISTGSRVAFFSLFVFLIGCTIIIRITPYLPFLLQYLEWTTYCCCWIIMIGPQIWMLIASCGFSYGSPSNFMAMLNFCVLEIIFTVGIPLWVVILISFFLQSRTRYCSIAYTIMIFSFIPFNVAHSVVLTRKMNLTVTEDLEKFPEIGSLILVVGILETLSGVCILIMCYIGRWSGELQERLDFWRGEKANEQLESIQKQKRGKAAGSTAVEDILHIILKAISDIRQAEEMVESQDPLLTESVDVLLQVQGMLTNTENLYAVQVNKSLESNFETDLEAKFLEIYARRRSKGRAIRKCEFPSALHSTGRQTESIVPILAPQPKGSAEFRRTVGKHWNCNILKASEEYPNIMVEVGAWLLEPLSEDLQTSPLKIRNYVYRLERLYHDNPYHNKVHGAMVAHSLMALLKILDIMESPEFYPVDSVVCVVAALGHDAGHPGRNNYFFAHGFQKMALLWNDKAILENFHCALVFKLLDSKSSFIFESLENDLYRSVRKKIIEMILVTDMSQHFDSVSLFKLRRQASGFNYMLEEDDMWFVVRMCMKCADLGHALVDWNQHLEWSLRITEEFYQQGDEEESLGLLKSALCDRHHHIDFAKSQKGFLEFVVQPLFMQIEELDPTDEISQICMSHLLVNKQKWQNFINKKTTIDIPGRISAMKTHSTSNRFLLVHLLMPKTHYLVSKKGKRRTTVFGKVVERGIFETLLEEEEKLERDEGDDVEENEDDYVEEYEGEYETDKIKGRQDSVATGLSDAEFTELIESRVW